MGTRLYARTENAAIIEKLAGVPQGTYAALQEFDSNPENQYDWGDTEKGYEVYCRKQQSPDLSTLEEFLLYGWGKFNRATIGVLERWQLNREVGSTTNPVIVRSLITSMGIDTKGVAHREFEGLKWG
jgi:hypothetical protein